MRKIALGPGRLGAKSDANSELITLRKKRWGGKRKEGSVLFFGKVERYSKVSFILILKTLLWGGRSFRRSYSTKIFSLQITFGRLDDRGSELWGGREGRRGERGRDDGWSPVAGEDGWRARIGGMAPRKAHGRGRERAEAGLGKRVGLLLGKKLLHAIT